MYEKFKDLIVTRKGVLFSGAWLMKALMMAGSVLTAWLKWNSGQVADWNAFMAAIQTALDQMGAATTQLAGIWAAFIAIEDSFHKLQLPWFTDNTGKTVVTDPRSTASSRL